MSLDGYNGVTHGYNSTIRNGQPNDANDVKAVIPPIGAIIAWGKRFELLTSGTTDGTTASKLVNSGDTFVTDGVAVEFYIVNTTDSTETYCTAVDSESTLSINDDIFVSGEGYEIYTTPRLADGWAECNGQALSDSDSPFNGATLPQLNNTERFLRGMTAIAGTAATTGGADTHDHAASALVSLQAGAVVDVVRNGVEPASTLPAYYEVVWIMRVK